MIKPPSLFVLPSLCLLKCVFNLFDSLKLQESLHFHLQILLDVPIVCILLELGIFCVEHTIDIVLVICGWPFRVHLLVVVEKVRIHFVNEPLRPGHTLLAEYEERWRNPIYESACWPLMCERQVEELENLEERAEAIDEPVFVLLRDAVAKIRIVESCS